ncbi:MAG: response regulator transcription factor [Leadbetterella sp.]|nr:response regulator transcription factor [Leadbetterella sp.]
MKILIVEDHLLTAESIRKCLTRAGHEVTGIAKSFREAVDAIIEHLPEVIIMDIGLEEAPRGGIEVLQEINTQVPVVFLTGKTDRETFLKATESGASAFLTKPFREEDLVFQVELAGQKIPKRRSDSFFVHDRGSYHRVNLKEVVCLLANKNFTIIHIKDRPEPLMSSINLGYFEKLLHPGNFLRITQSVIINEDYLVEIRGSQLLLEGIKTPLEISEGKRALLKKRHDYFEVAPVR